LPTDLQQLARGADFVAFLDLGKVADDDRADFVSSRLSAMPMMPPGTPTFR